MSERNRTIIGRFGLTPANALAFVIGILSPLLWRDLPNDSICLVVLAAAVFWIAAFRLPAAGWLLLGAAWAALRAGHALDARLPHALEGEDLVAVGRVRDLPRAGDGVVRFQFCPERVEHRGEAVIVRGCWRLAWHAPRRHGRDGTAGEAQAPPRIGAGERWQFTVRLKRPRSLINPGGFDAERQALLDGIAATGHVRVRAPHRRLSAADRGSIDGMREALAARIDAAIADPRAAAMLRGLAVGDRRGFTERDWETLRRTGTSHLFAISGLHVGLVAGLCGALGLLMVRLRPNLLRRAPRRLWLLPFAFVGAVAYALLAGLTVPTRRALLMTAVACLALASRRPATSWQIWRLALVAVLAIDPLAVLGAGFWLSFLGVAWLLLAAQGRRPSPAWRSLPRAQAAIALGLLPLGLGFFAQLSWLAPLVNLLAIPWVGFLVVPPLLTALPLLTVWPSAGQALLQMAHWTLMTLMRGLDRLAAWPDAAWTLPDAGPFAVVAGSIAALLLLLPGAPRWRWLAVPLCLPLLLPWSGSVPHGAVEVSVFDVGQGQAVLLRTRGHALLYDAGPRLPGGFDTGANVIVPALQALGVRRLDRLLISHADTDHAGGAPALLRAFPATPVVAGEAIVGIDATICREHDAWRWDGVEFEILHPPNGYPAPGNEQSCVLRVRAADGTRMLLTGDAGEVSELRMLNLHRDRLRSEVLLVGHHGSRHSTTTAFLRAVDPALALISVGHRSPFRHPHPDVLARLRTAGVRTLRTDLDGMLTLRLGEGTPAPVAWRRRFAPFWRER